MKPREMDFFDVLNRLKQLQRGEITGDVCFHTFFFLLHLNFSLGPRPSKSPSLLPTTPSRRRALSPLTGRPRRRCPNNGDTLILTAASSMDGRPGPNMAFHRHRRTPGRRRARLGGCLALSCAHSRHSSPKTTFGLTRARTQMAILAPSGNRPHSHREQEPNVRPHHTPFPHVLSPRPHPSRPFSLSSVDPKSRLPGF